FALAGTLTGLDRSVIEVAEADRPLQFVGSLANQENDRGMGLHALDRRLGVVACRIGEKGDGGALIVHGMRGAHAWDGPLVGQREHVVPYPQKMAVKVAPSGL